ncbi:MULTISPECIES: HlyD family secretion protein [unclassified Rubrivivax]|uniref:HlyD family secretion protein n=1 Tax=unclassified Rubrivivax TaxID=2649762 RepID=UPI001E30E96C|nr:MULTISPECIES: HlyD family efflux transporter periplasmic adaptor subunit [unclassified Rubrivivax]MCC9597045.1 HlyD family efflux transporter periplasmic adaptor subunit [Rubrivivax sp. JA1055]MCC9646696.1 HlyD family efflux transporter periplasmic adaptor subunit [Rubrivivax sp. JA1029]
MNAALRKYSTWIVLAAVVAAVAVLALKARGNGDDPGLVSGNGRLEATEIDVAAKMAGRVERISVAEGDFVRAGQPLATMQTSSLQAQHDEATARLAQAESTVASARAKVAVREADRRAAEAQVAQRESELDAATRRRERSASLQAEGASSAQEVDDDNARVRGVQAALVAARAQVAAAEAAAAAARTQVDGALATVEAARATVARIRSELDDTVLVAPRAGRVQFLVAQPGEVVGAGGKVLNLVDLADVYMTFFVPEAAAGRLALGSEVRIVLDAAPGAVIPAQVSFVASTAQFTPKTVETASERQKMMFRVKARIAPELLQRYRDQVKTGLPGVAWVRTDPAQPWPEHLALKVKP